jgi:hypothetical protein
MRDAGIWPPRAARRKEIQQPRAHQRFFGELIQIDGPEHHGSKAADLTARFSRTSMIQRVGCKPVRFVEGESTFAYMQATKLYIERYGKPGAELGRVSEPGRSVCP